MGATTPGELKAYNTRLGKAMKARRKELNYTQAEIAEEVQITRGHYALIERGYNSCSVISLIKLQVVLSFQFPSMPGVKPLQPKVKGASSYDMSKSK